MVSWAKFTKERARALWNILWWRQSFMRFYKILRILIPKYSSSTFRQTETIQTEKNWDVCYLLVLSNTPVRCIENRSPALSAMGLFCSLFCFLSQFQIDITTMNILIKNKRISRSIIKVIIFLKKESNCQVND